MSTHLPSPFPLPLEVDGYRLLRVIGRGSHAVVYYAESRSGPVALKMLVTSARINEVLAQRLRREAIALIRLRYAALPQVMATGEFAGRPYIVMEYLPGGSLAQRLGAPMAPERVVDIAIAVARSLAVVHQRGFVHRDVKPANILFDRMDRARLIDLDLFTEIQAGTVQHEFAGTFSYAAPEQTGLLRRPVDARADLYSLGVVMYECLTGRKPFSAADASELMRRRLTIMPPPVTDGAPDTPPVLAELVHRLLAADPDVRYQKAAELVGELARVQMSLQAQTAQASGATPGSALGPSRSSMRIPQVPRPAIARQEQLQSLLAALTGLVHGAGQCIAITGDAGTGKSRLARELIERARTRGLEVMHGACTSASPAPFLPLRQALTGARASEALMELLSLPAAGSLESRGRLIAALVRAVKDRVERRGATVLVLEDVHGADDGTLQVLAELADEIAESAGGLALLMVVTARVEAAAGAGSGSPTSSVDSSRAGRGAHVTRLLSERRATILSLGPLVLEQSQRMIAELLGDAAVDDALCARIHELAHGSPLAVELCVSSALDAGLMRFVASRWTLRGELADLELPGDMLAALGRRLEALEPATLAFLEAAAVLGPSLVPEQAGTLLAKLGLEPGSSEALMRHLHAAVMAGVLERREGGRYVFVHEELAQRLLERMSPAERARLHQRVAEALDRDTNSDTGSNADASRRPQPSGELAYELARHYAAGIPGQSPLRVYQTNLAAGLQATAEHADDLAVGFLTQALAAAERANVVPDPELHTRWGEALLRQGRFHEALARFDQALEHTRDPVSRARLFLAKSQVHLQWSNWTTASELLASAFDLLGVDMPRPGPAAAAWWGMRGLVRAVARPITKPDAKPEAKLDAKPLREPLPEHLAPPTPVRAPRGHSAHDHGAGERATVLLELYINTGFVALFLYDAPLMIQCMLAQRTYLERAGQAPEAVRSHAFTALVAAQLGRTGAAERAVAEGMRMARALGDPTAVALMTAAHEHVALALGRLGQAAELGEQIRREHGRWLPLTEYRNSRLAHIWLLLARGHVRQGLDAITELRQKLESEQTLDSLTDGYHAVLMAAAGNGREAVARLAAAEARWRRDKRALSRFHELHRATMRCLVCLFGGGAQRELIGVMDRAAAAIEQIALAQRWLPAYDQLALVAAGYARVHLARTATGALRQRRIRDLKLLRVVLERALGTPGLAAHKHVLLGWIALLEGQDDAAREHVSAAKERADRHDSPWPTVEAELLHAELLAARGAPHGSRLRHLAHAFQIALDHGLGSHAEALRVADPVLGAPAGHSVVGSLTGSLSAAKTREVSEMRLERHLDALMQVSLASATAVDPEEQARRAVSEVLAILGAERAFLFLVDRDGELSVVAGRDAEGRELVELSGFSSTLVQRVGALRRPLVIGGGEDGEMLGSISAVTHDLRSMIAAPLLMKERLTGVLYLDSRVATGVFTADDVGILQAICNHIAIALETARLAQLAKERAILERDLAVTSAVQALLVPQATSAAWPGIRVAASFQPATRSGGDWYWYERVAGNRLLALLGDATGHGAGSAMLTAVVASAYHTVMGAEPNIAPDELLARIHHTLAKICNGRYAVTMSALEIDPEERRMSWWNAGGTPLMILGPEGEVELMLEPGTPLGMQADSGTAPTLGGRTRTYRPGERVLMFSDGIKELPTADGRQLGYRRLRRRLAETRQLDSADALAHLASLRELLAANVEADDITLLLVDLE